MARANRAYKDGYMSELQEILQEAEHSPESVKGKDPASRLVRVIRPISLVEKSLGKIREELANLVQSDLYRLRETVLEANEAGRDLLQEMASHLDEEIASARERLAQGRRRTEFARGTLSSRRSCRMSTPGRRRESHRPRTTPHHRPQSSRSDRMSLPRTVPLRLERLTVGPDCSRKPSACAISPSRTDHAAPVSSWASRGTNASPGRILTKIFAVGS
jgi:hypothetical protein